MSESSSPPEDAHDRVNAVELVIEAALQIPADADAALGYRGESEAHAETPFMALLPDAPAPATPPSLFGEKAAEA